MLRVPSRAWLALVLLATAVTGALALPARASEPSGPVVVAVIRPPGSDRACQEIVTRIVAELMADDVPVVALTCSAPDSTCSPLAGMRVAAVVLVQRSEDISVSEVRAGVPKAVAPGRLVAAGGVGDRVHRLSAADVGAGPAALAIRTVELLKAMLVEGGEPASLGAGSDGGRVVQRADLDRPHAPPRATGDRHSVVPAGPRNLTMGVGVNIMGGFSGLSTAYGPAISLGRRTSDHVMLSMLVAGPAFGRDQQIPDGTVSVRHELALAQVELLGLFWKHIVLRAGVGAGVYHLHVAGQVTRLVVTPAGGFQMTESGSGGGFMGLLSWSAGAVANLRSDVGLFLDARMFVLTPTPAVLLGGFEIGRAGNPGLAVSSGLELRF